MILDAFVSRHGDAFSFTRQHSCNFAKKIAGDFNPIHDVDAKRFCVPGDLLFSYLLTRYGVSQQLNCQFSGMVSADVLLHCELSEGQIQVCDEQGRVYLTVQFSGEHTHDIGVIEPLFQDYVQFSGQNFPHILQPLMEQQGVMIHPLRPLVIYESMALSFTTLPTSKVELSLASSKLDIEGKRGNVTLNFILTAKGVQIGKGEKKMILSNLQPYDATEMQRMVDEYNNRKTSAGCGNFDL
ncbi:MULTISPECIES: DUF3581 family protein [Gammaproteobacteria]|uniref:DUF3581 family protein n=1 Tax=Gammaproteobacteria TaxID=1236 RepID=UPI001E506B69|nr:MULTISPECIES: DUF3581 family protein [unclassified Rheinheimera]MCC5452123.1 DUF3581 domain-containing protein [Rheinheimera sp. UJ51]MCF4009744.1 DUF3581 domain-containing protein [Rheinheimera sp. UJ63]MDP4945447.1 DUF3581 domain-containing protein [Alishewanella sp.]MDP5185937.1 DUF3581 domain-containing protein [Alishewanella sp.]